MALKKDNVYVIGHKNPDTDSICSAIAYAYYKNQLTGSDRYIPWRAGDVSDETAFVLDRFGVKTPDYIHEVSSRICDIEIQETPGVDRTISLREAYLLMHQWETSTLAITRHGRLEGVITLDDIAVSYMDVSNNRILSQAHTKIRKMEETVEGHVVVGNPETYFTEGKVLIAAADADYMSANIEPGDMVILGNRRELITRAIESKAGIILVCTVSDIPQDLKDMAEKAGSVVICADNDTYTVARMVGQSMPISYFMTRDNIVSFRADELTEDIKDVMSKKRFKNFPVTSKRGEYMGMISRRNLINEDKRKVILVDHNEKSQAVDGLNQAQILEIIDHHKIGSVETLSPIYFRNQPLGCTATIITKMYHEDGIEIPQNIAGLLLSAILSDTLMFRSPTCTPEDQKIAEELAGIAGVNLEDHANEMFAAGSNFNNKSMEEIFFMDFKKFSTAGKNYGIGQVNVLTEADGQALKERVISYYNEGGPKQGMDMVFFMITNIFEEVTDLIFMGRDAKATVENAFDKDADDHSILLPNVLSRKKQLLPALMTAMQE